MYNVIFRSMMVLSLRDKITLLYSLLLPFILIIGLDMLVKEESRQQLVLSGMVGISTLFWGMQGIAFQIHAQRNKGVYKLLKLTPLPLIKFVSIMVLARSVVGVTISMLIWLFGAIYYEFTITPTSFFFTLMVVIISSLCFTGFGFVIGNLSRNEGQINMLSNALQIPMIFMSEAFYSLEKAPIWISAVGKFFPFEHLVKLLGQIYLEPLEVPLLSIFIPILYLIVAIIVAVFSFRWDEGSSTS